MKYIRAIASLFLKRLLPNKVVLLIGPRRVGKTIFIKSFMEGISKEKCLVLNGDDVLDASLLKERSVANYKRLLDGKEYLIIDEAQHIPDIGMILKLIVDSIEGIKVVASGSSAFDLYHQVGEPLVGRKSTLHLYPLAQMEFKEVEDFRMTVASREERLIFGGYPELVQYTDWRDKASYLNEVMNDYLLKDILIYDGLRNSDKLFSLLKLLAFQVGREVSLEELGRQLAMSKNTVEKYLELLSKVFVIYKIGGYSKNLRKEVSKSSRWYFYDNGIRNAIIQNFNRLDMRTDVGELWENYLASERLKYQSYHQMNCNNYFWRTYDQQELDWVEEDAGKLRGYEFKYKLHKKIKPPAAWAKAYPDAQFEVIHQDNYLEWIV
jgi:uncharacterized protein